MSSEDYRWHYDYARLAWDSGFTFQTHRLKPSPDRNIGHIDVDKLIRERDVATIERHIRIVIEFSLDNDQTSVLDPSFVKIFRLSQLSVQYLLFCKKYLDHTVAIIKNEFTKNNEETNNLKRYVEELQHELANSKKHVKELKSVLSCQLASTQGQAIYQCNECPKAFSTEEYLLAHSKRRHNLKNSESSATSFQAETDRLQMEIKELKERLNNTEKFIQNGESGKSPRDILPVPNVTSKTNIIENTLLADLQQKFEFLRIHVENELRLLQTQKFDQEKYEKWFETFLNKLEQLHNKKEENIENSPGRITFEEISPKQDEPKQVNISVIPSTNEIKRNDSTTQTDATFSSEGEVCVNCKNKQSLTSKTLQVVQPAKQTNDVISDEETIQQKIRSETEDHFGRFEDIINNKKIFDNLIEDIDELSSDCCIPPENVVAPKNATQELIPAKSKERYEKVHKQFLEWCSKKQFDNITQNVLLMYFLEKADTQKSSTLWATYSMLKATLYVNENVDISKFSKLLSFLKRKSKGYKAKQSKTFTKSEIHRFLTEADDDNYLLIKVALIFGIAGACRRTELTYMLTDHIEDKGSILIITIPDTNNRKPKCQRTFLVTRGNLRGINLLEIYRKYIRLRPQNVKHRRLFLFYKSGKCSKQPVGINMFGKMPKMIAEYLGLQNPGDYTGHSFRRSSASVLTTSDGDINTLDCHGECRSSTVTEEHVERSTENKREIANQIFRGSSNYSHSSLEAEHVNIKIEDDTNPDDWEVESLNTRVEDDTNPNDWEMAPLSMKTEDDGNEASWEV